MMSLRIFLLSALCTYVTAQNMTSNVTVDAVITQSMLDSTIAALPITAAGDTAWILTSTALVLLMTPALGFFYGGEWRTCTYIHTRMLEGMSGIDCVIVPCRICSHVWMRGCSSRNHDVSTLTTPMLLCCLYPCITHAHAHAPILPQVS